MYNHPLSCVKLNSNVTDCFPTESGVRHVDSLSPSLFAIFINNLASEMKQLDIRIDIENGKNCILLSAQVRSLLAQIRSGTLPLHVETRRFTNAKVENRTCVICNSKEI